eukprot:TRINITY_DN2739_c0_g1_i3.p1 TRINITY_DN2739_c0_g1~~TRINITY_DN2739_c0_g1_i3.p1  ORF type:complete len:223 (-),score=39.21 TRINITY_DN2739_c0_g1_i3:107-775(-)
MSEPESFDYLRFLSPLEVLAEMAYPSWPREVYSHADNSSNDSMNEGLYLDDMISNARTTLNLWAQHKRITGPKLSNAWIHNMLFGGGFSSDNPLFKAGLNRTQLKNRFEEILKAIDDYIMEYHPNLTVSELNIFDDRVDEPYDSTSAPTHLINWAWLSKINGHHTAWKWNKPCTKKGSREDFTVYYWSHEDDPSLKRRAIEYNAGRSQIWKDVRLTFIVKSP